MNSGFKAEWSASYRRMGETWEQADEAAAKNCMLSQQETFYTQEIYSPPLCVPYIPLSRGGKNQSLAKMSASNGGMSPDDSDEDDDEEEEAEADSSNDSFYGYAPDNIPPVMDSDFSEEAVETEMKTHLSEASFRFSTFESKLFGTKANGVDEAKHVVETVKDNIAALLKDFHADTVRAITTTPELSANSILKSVEHVYTSYQAVFSLPKETGIKVEGEEMNVGSIQHGPLELSAGSGVKQEEEEEEKPSNISPKRPESSEAVLELIKEMNIPEIFQRTGDNRAMWQMMRQNAGNERFKLENLDNGKYERDLVRILGYELMSIETRIGRQVTAFERRYFMKYVLQALPVSLEMERYANSTSKGKLDMFVRNKRHYQTKKYGIAGLPKGPYFPVCKKEE